MPLCKRWGNSNKNTRQEKTTNQFTWINKLSTKGTQTEKKKIIFSYANKHHFYFNTQTLVTLGLKY